MNIIQMWDRMEEEDRLDRQRIVISIASFVAVFIIILVVLFVS